MKPRKLIEAFAVIFSLILITMVNGIPIAYGQTPPVTKSIANITPTFDTKKNYVVHAAENRINSLYTLSIKITASKKLSNTSKTALTAEVQNYITQLTTLKTKIQSDTDTTTLKADTQTLIKNFRVYAFLIPQLQMLSAATAVTDTIDKLTSYTTTLQISSQSTRTSTDSATTQNILSDAQNKISDAKIQSQKVITSVSSLTPDGFPANQPTLQSARTMLQTAKSDLHAAVQDFILVSQTKTNNKGDIVKSTNKTSMPPITKSLSPVAKPSL